MTSASELFHNRRSRIVRSTHGLEEDLSVQRPINGPHRRHGNARMDRASLHGADSFRRGSQSRVSSHRPSSSLQERESVVIDELGSGQSASGIMSNSDNNGRYRDRMRHIAPTSPSLPGAVLLARERLLQRLRAVSVSGNRETNQPSSGVSHNRGRLSDETMFLEASSTLEDEVSDQHLQTLEDEVSDQHLQILEDENEWNVARYILDAGWSPGSGPPVWELLRHHPLVRAGLFNPAVSDALIRRSIASEGLSVEMQTERRSEGLSKEALSKLESEVFSSSEECSIEVEKWTKIRECSICLESFTDGEELTRLPCGHRFHSCCLYPWITSCGDCPNCRAGIVKSFSV